MKRAFRWGLAFSLGLIFWVLFDPLPAAFFWLVIITMMGAMSIHTILHRQPDSSFLLRQACRFAFFLSFPLLIVFAGNRVAVWSVAAEESHIGVNTDAGDFRSAQGVVASEAYTMLKSLQKEEVKSPAKAKKTLKKVLGKYLKQAKQMDGATRVLFIILGILLLLVIVILVLLIVGFSSAVNGCAGNDDDDGCL